MKTNPSPLFLFAAMGCVGITTEIFFTAIIALIDQIQSGNDVSLRLMGQSYIWMFPIYGIAGLAFPLLIRKFSFLHPVFRAMTFAVGILIVEYITGGLLDVFTGSCPWEYTTGWHIHGYIRLDYYPLWAGFAFMVERILKILDPNL